MPRTTTQKLAELSNLEPSAAEIACEEIAKEFIESGHEPDLTLHTADYQESHALVCADRYWRMRIEKAPTCHTARLCAQWLHTHADNLSPAQVATIEEKWSLGYGFISSATVETPEETCCAPSEGYFSPREHFFAVLYHAGKLRANYNFPALSAHLERYRSGRTKDEYCDRPIIFALLAFAALGQDSDPYPGLAILRTAWENRTTHTTADVCLNALGAARPFPEQGHLLRAYAKEAVTKLSDDTAYYWLASGGFFTHDYAGALDAINKSLALLPARGSRGSHALMREQRLLLRQRITQEMRRNWQ
ncbi:hypothetical protein JGS22_015250 [Streptomyces sp. P38-E01]|uniref:Uncharacterized protein n=1 Tax=Streptomyces tardus TaxID=2780544 RepID=A0A949JFA0_9ACTN|nr:hypothetical protein [Streptomyces tardus]MBU7598931.1 hypothetical protein [Streptomyces tardus]